MRFYKFFRSKNSLKILTFQLLRGERGIRTPGPVTVNSFQDCRNRPLCHFSNTSQPFPDCGCKYRKLFYFCKFFMAKKYANCSLIKLPFFYRFITRSIKTAKNVTVIVKQSIPKI